MKKTIIALCLLLCAATAASGCAEQLTIMMPMRTVGEAQSTACEYASQLMRDSGFDISFEVFEGESGAYMDDYIDSLLERAGEDMAYILTDDIMNRMLIREDAFFMLDDAQDSLFVISENRYDVNRLAVLVKNEYAEMYDCDVYTAADLISLMIQIQDAEMNGAPCAASPILYDRMYYSGGCMALNLFMPQYGYYSVMENTAAPIDVFGRFDDDSVLDVYTIDEAADAIIEFMALSRDGLLDLYTLGRNMPDLSKYPLLLVNTKDFSDSLMLANNPSLAKLDMSGYRMYVLYPDELPEIACAPAKQVRALALSAYGCDEFSRFAQWLKDEDNYLKLLYGAEGVDYEMQDGAPLALQTDVNYALWEQRAYFLNDEFEAAYARNKLPINYIAQMEGISHPDMLAPELHTLESMREALTESDLDKLTQAAASFRAKLEAVERTGVSDARRIYDIFDDPNFLEASDIIKFALSYAR